MIILTHLAPRLGLMDEPGRHKRHVARTPVVGGLAMFTGFLFSVLLVDTPLSGYRALFAGIAILVIVGVLDDMRELSTRYRFVPQITAAILMAILGGVVLKDLGRLLNNDIVSLGVLSLPVTVLSAVGVINALNMSDGMDGQAGCLYLTGIVALVFLASYTGRLEQLPLLSIFGSVVLAFLAFNLRGLLQPGRGVFMGDAGSMFLGFSLCWFFIDCSQGQERTMRPVTALWIFAVPLIDAVSVMLRRWVLGQSATIADRTHYHHILSGLGMPPPLVLAIIVGVAATLALAGVAGEIAKVPEWWMFYAFILLFGVYFVASYIQVDRLGLSRAK